MSSLMALLVSEGLDIYWHFRKKLIEKCVVLASGLVGVPSFELATSLTIFLSSWRFGQPVLPIWRMIVYVSMAVAKSFKSKSGI